MQNKLQELTDRLYNEGLSKGRQEAEEMKKNAKSEAARIIADAKNEAARIVADAEKEAAELKDNAEKDVRNASMQTVSALKKQIEDMIITRSISGPVSKNMHDAEFVQKVIMTIAGAFNPENPEPADIRLILPESMQKEFTSILEKNADETMKKRLDIRFSRQLSGGFQIGPAKEGYIISFSDRDLEEMLGEFLRPATRKLLFG